MAAERAGILIKIRRIAVQQKERSSLFLFNYFTPGIPKEPLLFLPAYSPQFNLIERFWKLVKKCCLHARYYPTFQDFKKSILHFIETAHIEKKNMLKSLLSFNFQSFNEVNVNIS